MGGVCPVAWGLVPHSAVVGVVAVGHLGGNFGGGIEDATETGVLVAGSTVDSTAVYSRPGGVVAVAVFDWMDGIVAAFIDVAVVTIDTTVVTVFDACGNYTVVGTAGTIVAVAAEAIC